MSLTKCTVNTNIIESLPDAPAMAADELKRKFDESPTGIKGYINDVMLLEIEQLVANEKKNLQTIITNAKNELLTNISEKILEDNKNKYYIGKIIIDTANVNPATYLGFGTWEYWGSGRVPVGVDISQDEFNEVEKTGGEKTHILTLSEMPQHNHAINTANKQGNMEWGYQFDYGEHDASYNGIMEKVGGSKPHNNMQPYITCYMWKRVS